MSRDLPYDDDDLFDDDEDDIDEFDDSMYSYVDEEGFEHCVPKSEYKEALGLTEDDEDPPEFDPWGG